MAIPLAHLLETLEQYARALSTYVSVIDDAAQKSSPSSRAVYQRALADADELSAHPPTDPLADRPLPVEALVRYIFDILDRLDEVRQNLDKGVTAALNPQLLEESMRRMSQTYIEGVEAKASRLREARSTAATVFRTENSALLKMWVPHIIDVSPTIVAQVFHERIRLGQAAALYASALETWLSRGDDVSSLVEGAKNYALGLELDTVAMTREAQNERAGLHPLQAMGITFGLTAGVNCEATSVASANKAGVKIDATLPQAKTAVRYNLGPLINIQEVSQFGPLANMNSGLNFRLVERLQTITVAELAPVPRTSDFPSPKIEVADGGEPRIVRTIDRGETYETLLSPGRLPAEAYNSVGAGPRPRVSQCGILLEEAVFGVSCQEGDGFRTFSDPEGLLEDYDAKVDMVTPDYTLDELGQVLITKFIEEYDTWPATSAEELLAAFLGQRGEQNLYRTYIAQALAVVSKQGADRQLLRSEAGGGSMAAMFGSRALGARGGRQEILLTQIANLRDSIKAIQRKLLAAFLRLDGSRRAHAIYGETPGAVISAEAVRRNHILNMYRTVIDEALYAKRRPSRAAKAEEKGDAVEPRLSLKLYVLEHLPTTL